tara:strand:+ start:269 stop:790 length:522 start_codon:yes stop_codon:yes gene_type:complete
MAFTPTNYIYENLLKKFQTILRTEYDGSIPIYIGSEYKKQKSSHIRLFINTISNIDNKQKSIINLVNMDIILYLNIKSDDMQAKKKLSDMTNRLEQALFNNKLNSDNLYFDGIIDSIEFDTQEGNELFIDNMKVSRINYSVKMPLKYQVYGYFQESDGDRILTLTNDNFLVLN